MIAFLPFPTEKFKFAVFLAGIDTVQSMGNKSTLVEDVIEIETTNLQNRLLQFEDDEAYDSTRANLLRTTLHAEHFKNNAAKFDETSHISVLCADPYYFLKFKYLDIEESELTEGQKVAHEAWVLKCVPIYTIAAAMAAHLGEAKTFKSARDQYLMMEQLYEQLVTKKPIDKSLIGYVAQLSSRSMALYSLYGPMIIRNTAKKEFLRGVLIDHIRAKKLIFEKWNENKWNQNI